MRSFRWVLALLWLSSVAAGNAWGVVYYTITDLGTLGGNVAKAYDINAGGQVVGCSSDFDCAQRGFLYQTWPMTNLGTLNGGATVARGINDGGQITGSSYDTTLHAYRAYDYNGGTMTSIGTLPGDFDSYGRAINNSGQIAGISRDFSYNAHAFLYDGGTMTDLGMLTGFTQSKAYDLNDSGEAVGFSYNVAGNGHAFLYDGGLTDLGTLGGASSYAQGINESGQVVGAAMNSAGTYRAFVYDGGSMSDLGALGGFSSVARDINAGGTVVGSAETAALGVCHAFVYDNGTMTDLKSLIDPTLQWNLQTATAINDSGSIVGYGCDQYGDMSAWRMTPITREYAELNLAPTYTGLRMLQGTTQSTGDLLVLINQPGNTPTDFTLTPSASLSVGAATGTIAPAVVTPAPVAMAWADTSTIGARSGSIDLANDSDPSDPDDTMGVSGAVVANRALNVVAVGSSTNRARIMPKKALVTTVNSGSDPLVDGDDVATRVKPVPGGKISDGKATVNYTYYQPGGALLPMFNGVDQSAKLDVTFKRTGHYAGTIDLTVPPTTNSGTPIPSKVILADGEDASLGAVLQPALLTYDVDVLQQRKLKAIVKRLDLGNVLCGANIDANYIVTSRNAHPGPQYTTMVTVAPGGQILGELTAGQTLVAAGGYVNVPLTGTLNTYGTVKVNGRLPVVTAEAPEVQDDRPYRSVRVRYKANVGLAKLGKGTPAFGIGETVLSARVAASTTMTDLSSKVNPKRTLAAYPLPASAVTGTNSLPAKKLYGAVGSEAKIVTSTDLPADTTVTMQWRKRLPGEAYVNGISDPTLPSGCSWLTSDVVKIGGVPSAVTYALQMSFDNRINLALSGPIDGSLANAFPGLYLVEFDTLADHWIKATDLVVAGAHAEQGVFESLSDFLSDHSTLSLPDLAGSWGVAPSTSVTGTGYSWAIITGGGSGIFAVDPTSSTGGDPNSVPEPSALVLLVSAAAAALAFGLRRRLK